MTHKQTPLVRGPPAELNETMVSHQRSTESTSKVLFLTLSEYGQSSTILAIASELLNRPDEAEIHIGSFPGLQKRIDTIEGPARSQAPIQFHRIEGITHLDAMIRAGVTEEKIRHPPLTRSSLPWQNIMALLTPWTKSEYKASTVPETVSKGSPDTS